MEKVVADFPTPGFYTQVDLTKTEEITRAVGEAIEKMGGLDILINNGAPTNEDIKEPTDVSVLRHLLDIHVVGCMAFIDACKEELIKNKGCVINVSSALSEVVYEAMIPYSIAKAAQDAMTRNMAMVWARYGVRVNSINPGVVDTETWEQIAAKMGVTKQEVLDMNKNLHAMGTYSLPEEQANAILFMCSRSSSGSITGNRLFTDGGIRLTNWFNLGLQPNSTDEKPTN
eukprot:TRINITY_DN61559_c0_g1_i3.p2 TRINITY_DN61559_c0_g1~~TRINITY_DN61559_c0_g1_i3.p2  ORF type:complete len:265 (-),score=36.61 TRINITY_DN61559_c0_g1_i3:732-1418(-)